MNIIAGRESPNTQCYECSHCTEPERGWTGSSFRCDYMKKDYQTWHMDVPNECPCKGLGWLPKNKEDNQMTPNVDKIIEHYNHAREKHPYFCDGLLPSQVKNGPPKYDMMKKIAYNLQSFRIRLKRAEEIHNLLWNEVLNAEVWEVTEAIAKGKKSAAIEEVYDCIAVLLRTIDVLEGRQKLGKPEEVKQ